MELQDRIKLINKSGKIVSQNLKILTPDLQQQVMPDLSILANQNQIEKLFSNQTKLIVIDSLSTLMRSGDENDNRHWVPIQEWLLRLRSAGKSVLLIHHAGKSGTQRGTSKREDVLDTVIELKEKKNHLNTDSTYLEIHFKKARSLYGDQIKPYEAKLDTIDGRYSWTFKTLKSRTQTQVIELKAAGMTPKEISNELDVSLSIVYRHLRDAPGQHLN